MEAAPSSSEQSLIWSDKTTVVSTNSAVGYGKSNTTAILSTSPTAGAAFYWNGRSYGDFTLNQYYWSSTQTGNTTAYSIYADDGHYNSSTFLTNTTSFLVRAVRRF
jgi:hypothetical protein